MKNKKLFSWALYDWANSAFSTTIMAGFFPVFLKAYWGQGVDPVLTTAHLGTTLSISGLSLALISPYLGAIADVKAWKKLFLFAFMVIGALGCVLLGTLDIGEWYLALWVYGISYAAFGASGVFYDSLLPSIARGTKMDYASSLGYSLGYLGGGVLFLLNVLWYLMPEKFGFESGVQAVKASFISVGIWWVLFSIPLFRNVPEPAVIKSNKKFSEVISGSLKALLKTLKEIFANKNLRIYLVSYWLFIDGVYTVITMAVDYGMGLGLESKHLISALLITQFVGFPCAWAFGLVTPRWGCRKPILFCILVYSVTLILATQMSQAWHFYALAAVIGLVQGGVQSLSRSLFGNMTPVEKSGEYFAFFNLVGRFAAIMGPTLVGITVALTQNQRTGMLGILVLFILGGYLLLLVKEPSSDVS